MRHPARIVCLNDPTPAEQILAAYKRAERITAYATAIGYALLLPTCAALIALAIFFA